MMKETLTQQDKKQIQQICIYRHVLLCNKLNSDESHIINVESKFDESELSELSLEDEVNFSNFVITDDEPKRTLIFEDSPEFESIVKMMVLITWLRRKLIFQKSNIPLIKFLLQKDWTKLKLKI